MLVELVSPDFKFENEHGSLIQLVHEGWNQVNVLTSAKGSKRGGHYHKINEEIFFIVSGEISLEIQKDGQCEEYHFQKGDMFKILPFSIHNFTFLEDTTMVAMYDKGVELKDGSKDIYDAKEILK